MKATTRYQNTKVIPYRSRKVPAYPNAPEKNYLISRTLDYALTVATSVALVSALLFLFTAL